MKLFTKTIHHRGTETRRKPNPGKAPFSTEESFKNSRLDLLCGSVVNDSVVNDFVRYNAIAMIAKDLLKDLVCPVCIKPLEYRQNPESLKCSQCRRVYAVEEDIPIMLVDRATIEN